VRKPELEEVWKCGSMEVWKYGSMEVWKVTVICPVKVINN
jgi:hypothetical protein